MINEYIEIIITIANKEDAEMMANNLVKSRLAACCQIAGPVMSIYTWKDELCKDKEYILTIKTRKSLFQKIKKHIIEKHTYDTPQIIAVDISEISEDYKNWMDENIEK